MKASGRERDHRKEVSDAASVDAEEDEAFDGMETESWTGSAPPVLVEEAAEHQEPDALADVDPNFGARAPRPVFPPVKDE